MVTTDRQTDRKTEPSLAANSNNEKGARMLVDVVKWRGTEV